MEKKKKPTPKASRQAELRDRRRALLESEAKEKVQARERMVRTGFDRMAR